MASESDRYGCAVVPAARPLQSASQRKHSKIKCIEWGDCHSLSERAPLDNGSGIGEECDHTMMSKPKPNRFREIPRVTTHPLLLQLARARAASVGIPVSRVFDEALARYFHLDPKNLGNSAAGG